MKKLIMIIGLMLSASMFTLAQETIDNISLYVYVPQNTEVPEVALSYLENRLTIIATSSGNADFIVCNRFVLTAKVNVVHKDIIVGPPQKVSQTLSVTLQIGDVEEHKLFASTTLTLVGIGTNLTKSYIEAFKGITKNEKQIQEFLQNGKNKVQTYYISQCEAICKKAMQLSRSQQYDEALYDLVSIPDIDNICTEKVQNLIAEIVQLKINTEGTNYLNKAKLAWAQAQNEKGAEEAIALLVQINPIADCQSDVNILVSEIKSKLKDDAERNWQFQLKQYNDNVEKEKQMIKNEQEIRKTSVQAARDAAIVFANNLPKQEIILW